MARRLRIERPGGRYHITARGNEGKEIFQQTFQEECRSLLRSTTRSSTNVMFGVEKNL